MFVFADTGASNPTCVSTGDKDALSRAENSKLKELVTQLGMSEEGIKLKPGMIFVKYERKVYTCL